MIRQLAAIFLLLVSQSASAYAENNLPNYKLFSETQYFDGVPELFKDIKKEFPSCEIIFISDEYFEKFFRSWMTHIRQPLYTFSLNRNLDLWENSDSGKNLDQLVVNPRGSGLCSNIMITCQTISSCKTENSELIFTTMMNHGFLKRERRSFLYIQDETTSTIKPTLANSLMNDTVGFLGILKSHITIIRRFVPIPPSNVSGEKSRSDPSTFHLLTFTPNWLPGGSPVLHAVWSKSRGFWKFMSDGIKIQRQHIKRGATARFGVSYSNSLPMIKVDGAGKIEGIESDIVNIIQEKFDLKLEFIKPSSRQKKFEDQAWTGTEAVKNVFLGKADFGIGKIVPTKEHQEAGVLFTPAFYVLQGAVACPLPQELPKWRILMAPFKIIIWGSLIASTCTVLILAELLQKLFQKLFPKPPRLKHWSDAWDMTKVPLRESRNWFAWIYTLGPILQRSIPINYAPTRTSFRCFFGFWLACGFLTSSFYGSTLIGTLSFPPTEQPVDSLRQLLNLKESWTVTDVVEKALGKTQDIVERHILDNRVLFDESETSGADSKEYEYAMQTGNCVLAERFRAQYVIMTNYSIKNAPLMRMAANSFLIGPLTWAVRGDVDFILMSYLQQLFISFQDHGFLNKAQKRYYLLGKSVNRKEQVLKSLEVETLQVVFFVFLIGMTASLLTFFMELQIPKIVYMCTSTSSRQAEGEGESGGRKFPKKMKGGRITTQYLR